MGCEVSNISAQQAVYFQTETSKLASTIALCFFYLQDKKRKELREVLEDAYEYVCKKGYFKLEEHK